jgi:hypothetical protein
VSLALGEGEGTVLCVAGYFLLAEALGVGLTAISDAHETREWSGLLARLMLRTMTHDVGREKWDLCLGTCGTWNEGLVTCDLGPFRCFGWSLAREWL